MLEVPSAGVLDSMTTGLLEKPALGPCRMKLRPYQEDAIDAVREEFRAGKKSTLLVLPTGTGKTITFGMIARLCIERGRRVLVLAHRDELIQQAVNKLDMLGVEAGVEKAESQARALFDPDVVIATVQTMQRRRLETWPRNHFGLIVTDEAHHATAASYRKIYKHFSSALHLGVTATADRADEENLGQVYQSIAYELSLWDAMIAPPPGPYLCRLKFCQCDVEIDLRDIRTTAGDFNLADLESRIRPHIDTLANAIRQEIGDRKTLVFTPDVGSAQAMATALRSLGFRADWVSGNDPDRAQKVEALHSGEIKVLCNCNLLTEGFDCVDIAGIVLCRPTKSRPLYAQMVGRGARLAKDKPDCLIVDFNFLTAKHELVKAVELFDTNETDSEILEIADRIARENKGTDLANAIEQARIKKTALDAVRIRARERQIAYRKVSYDPVSVFETLGVPWRGGKDAVVTRATEGQVRYLKTFGVEDAPNLSKTRASTLIDYLAHRRKEGLATQKQVAWLIAKGNLDPVDARAKTFKEASQLLDKIFNNR